jgi:hypothetical protein
MVHLATAIPPKSHGIVLAKEHLATDDPNPVGQDSTGRPLMKYHAQMQTILAIPAVLLLLTAPPRAGAQVHPAPIRSAAVMQDSQTAVTTVSTAFTANPQLPQSPLPQAAIDALTRIAGESITALNTREGLQLALAAPVTFTEQGYFSRGTTITWVYGAFQLTGGWSLRVNLYPVGSGAYPSGAVTAFLSRVIPSTPGDAWSAYATATDLENALWATPGMPTSPIPEDYRARLVTTINRAVDAVNGGTFGLQIGLGSYVESGFSWTVTDGNPVVNYMSIRYSAQRAGQPALWWIHCGELYQPGQDNYFVFLQLNTHLRFEPPVNGALGPTDGTTPTTSTDANLPTDSANADLPTNSTDAEAPTTATAADVPTNSTDPDYSTAPSGTDPSAKAPEIYLSPK